jgi:DNA-binding CsgD family transcriptional regulator
VTVETAYEERMSNGSDRLLLMLADNIDNLRESLTYALRTRPEDALRLAAAMREEWVRRNPSEGRLWLDRLMPRYRHRDRYLGRALLAVGHIAMVKQADGEAQLAFEQSRDVCSGASDAAGEAWAIFFMGAAGTLASDDAAQRHLEQALELQQRLSCAYGVLQARATMGQLLVIRGQRLDEGQRLLEDVLATAEGLGNRWSAGHAHVFLGLLGLRLRDWNEAEPHFHSAVREFTVINDQVMLAAAACGLARASVRKNARYALTLAAAASEVHVRLGSRFAPVWSTLQEETRAEATGAIGRSAAGASWERGRRLTIAEVAEAIESRHAVGRPPGGLTRRELEVAELVARGLSNRAMAERLHVSERTAEGHVLHILNKLGLSNRTQVATWLQRESSTETRTG